MAIYTKVNAGDDIVNGSATVCTGKRTRTYNNADRNVILPDVDFSAIDARYYDLDEKERDRHGVPTTTQVTVDTTAAQVLAVNPARVKALLVNAGSTTIYLGHDNTLTTANGIPLPAGANYEDDVETAAWWAVVASGTGDLRIESVEQ